MDLFEFCSWFYKIKIYNNKDQHENIKGQAAS